MSSLEFKDSKQEVGSSKTVKSSKESVDDVNWEKSVASEEFEDFNEVENENSLSSGYVNFLRDFKKRYGDYYTDHQIKRAAETRWNEMSFRHRCQYSAEPMDTFHLKPDLVESNSGSSLPSSMDSEHRMHTERRGPTDTFFGASATKGNGCTPRKRENKYSKPRMRKSCPKPRAKCSKPRRSCAKPKQKCARPRKACPRPRKMCAKPKPRCPKPKSSKPKCMM
ncbi:histone-like protein 18C isoform X1 [Drosophila santomea]|uniref:histone-like protein 18C isoform X1 n=1 Tax=Drosophila santomea TaxID=129105 RepID=UPI001953FAF3|nr:histone-like protein 18C isoform X1 [Drosophila santomea]